LTLTKFYYGEVDEKDVDPELVRRATAALDFCKRRYGGGTDSPRIRWMHKDRTAHAFAKLRDVVRQLYGEEIRYDQRAYQESDESWGGFVRPGLETERPKIIFISVENTLGRILWVIAHEFYHARFSPMCMHRDPQDEKAADEFAERIEREMREAKREKETEEWRRKYRELQSQR
jgi:hypothetical protein